MVFSGPLDLKSQVSSDQTRNTTSRLPDFAARALERSKVPQSGGLSIFQLVNSMSKWFMFVCLFDAEFVGLWLLGMSWDHRYFDMQYFDVFWRIVFLTHSPLRTYCKHLRTANMVWS